MAANKDFVTRINLKTDARNRNALIDYCLYSDKQYIAIGWSYIYDAGKSTIASYKDFFDAVKIDCRENGRRLNHALNVFLDASEDDLFWTRDLDGGYWICRTTGRAEPACNCDLDIGAIIPVKAYKVGLQVPGKLKASFTRANGGVTQTITDQTIVEYSKYIYNKLSGEEYYNYIPLSGNIIDNLPDFDLEELVISYLQLEKDYYVLSNSIANKSTTIKIECELISRSLTNHRKAVIQVKAGNTSIDAKDYLEYVNDGYIVYLYARIIENSEGMEGIEIIKRIELEKFYEKYKSILPNSITMWENLCL